MAEEGKTFKELYCEANKVLPKDFERRFFLRLLHLNGLLLHVPIRNLSPKYFATDEEFIRKLGDCRNAAEAKTVYSEFSSRPYNRSFLRRGLGLRIYKSRAMQIVNQTLPARQPEPMTLPRRVVMPNTELTDPEE